MSSVSKTPASRQLGSRGIRLAMLGLIAGSFGYFPGVLRADDKPARPQRIRHQVTGLFCPEREQDLKELFDRQLPRFKLVSIDYAKAEAIFEYDPAKEFPGATPAQVIERFDNEVRQATRHTFGIKPLCTTPADRLKLVEFSIVGLDCKACSLAVYEMIYRLPGVVRATASFREGKATALIDPGKISRADIDALLRQRSVTLKPLVKPKDLAQ